MASKIGGNQTAYLRTRLINDNIRAIHGTINITNLEERAKGLLVALDAKKAFDSVDHKYIEKCFISFGCERFIPIFRTLYAELQTDIIINGQVTKGFCIKRGVKQGDALSCIIFIMCMEPLLRNIEANPRIEPIHSETLNESLPKVYAYADDVNATINDSNMGLNELFSEYERLSRMSGLELNADKTELMLLGRIQNEKSYNVTYLNDRHVIESKDKVKINGILFQRDRTQMEKDNVEIVMSRIDGHLKRWSRRNLSTLGKILIVKSFGISQLVYLLQSITLNEKNFKLLNSVLYKFIWNKHYSAAKAPERIKREIVNAPIKLGGLGMLDIVALDESLKLRALGRLMDTKHPFLGLIRRTVKLDQYFDPKIGVGIDEISVAGVRLLMKDRDKLWGNSSLDTSRDLLNAIAETDIRSLVNSRGKASIPFYMLWSQGQRKLKHLTIPNLSSIERFIDHSKLTKLNLAIRTRSGNVSDNFLISYIVKGRPKILSSMSSKEFRECRANKSPRLELKLGSNLTPLEGGNWGLRISKLTSTRHKNIILRVAHGDIYTKERLARYGLNNDPSCPRCQAIETLQHKFIECPYVKKIWETVFGFTKELTIDDLSNEPLNKSILSCNLNSDITSMTINAEILQRILSLKDNNNYTLHPKFFVKLAISHLTKREKQANIKTNLNFILNAMNG